MNDRRATLDEGQQLDQHREFRQADDGHGRRDARQLATTEREAGPIGDTGSGERNCRHPQQPQVRSVGEQGQRAAGDRGRGAGGEELEHAAAPQSGDQPRERGDGGDHQQQPGEGIGCPCQAGPGQVGGRKRACHEEHRQQRACDEQPERGA